MLASSLPMQRKPPQESTFVSSPRQVPRTLLPETSPPYKPSKRKSEEVPVGYYASKENMDMALAAEAPANAKSMLIKDYTPPQPVVGRDSFDLYLDKYIRNPERSKKTGNIVEIRFKVRPDSTISNIKILSSPGKAWSEEAIRLIEEGPSWNPAKKNGQPVEEEVKLRILFK